MYFIFLISGPHNTQEIQGHKGNGKKNANPLNEGIEDPNARQQKLPTVPQQGTFCHTLAYEESLWKDTSPRGVRVSAINVRITDN
jgi:hypothetical protein